MNEHETSVTLEDDGDTVVILWPGRPDYVRVNVGGAVTSQYRPPAGIELAPVDDERDQDVIENWVIRNIGSIPMAVKTRKAIADALGCDVEHLVSS